MPTFEVTEIHGTARVNQYGDEPHITDYHERTYTIPAQPSPSSVGAAIRALKCKLPDYRDYAMGSEQRGPHRDGFRSGFRAAISEAAALAEQVQQVWSDDNGVHFSASGNCANEQVEIVNSVCQSIGMQGYFDALAGVWRADGGCQEIPILRAIVAAYTLGKSAPSLPILQERDLKSLKRFFECCDDPDSGGHDVSKEAMTRLREIGVVESKGFGRHQITAFGDYVLCIETDTVAKFPLKTYAEYEADSKAAHEAKLAAPSIAQDGQKPEDA